MSERIDVQRHADGVVEVRLARADKMNALDAAMFDAVIAAGTQLVHDREVRAVVLSGQGRAFCAGLDMQSFARMQGEPTGQVLGAGAAADLATRTHGIANAAQQLALVWRQVPVPVIAAVHGVAFGGGLQLALGADLRLVAPDARLSVMEIEWGLVPDMGGMLLMRELLRADVMRDLTFSGRVVSGEEAVALGLCTRLAADPHAEALAMARAIAGRSPDAIRAGKRLLDLASTASAAELLLAESLAQKALIGQPNHAEAVQAKLARRSPRFGPPAAEQATNVN